MIGGDGVGSRVEWEEMIGGQRLFTGRLGDTINRDGGMDDRNGVEKACVSKTDLFVRKVVRSVYVCLPFG